MKRKYLFINEVGSHTSVQKRDQHRTFRVLQLLVEKARQVNHSLLSSRDQEFRQCVTKTLKRIWNLVALLRQGATAVVNVTFDRMKWEE